jgi:hypothetical protein
VFSGSTCEKEEADEVETTTLLPKGNMMRKRYYFYLMAFFCFGCATLLWRIEPEYVFAYKEIYIDFGNRSNVKYSPEYERGMKIFHNLGRCGVKVNGKWVPVPFYNCKKIEKALNYILQDIEENGFPENDSETSSIMVAVSVLYSSLGRTEEKRAFYLQIVEQFPEGSCPNHLGQRFLEQMSEFEGSSSCPFPTTGEILHMYFRVIVRELFVLLCVMGEIALFIAVWHMWLEWRKESATTEDGDDTLSSAH